MLDKIYKAWSGDCSEEGYDTGSEDKKNGRPKNKWKFFTKTPLLNKFWNFDRSFETFSQNYDKGYLDRDRVEHGVYSSYEQKGDNMTFVDKYANHLRIISVFETNIEQLERTIEDKLNAYSKQINSAESQGFAQDYTNQLKGRYQDFKKKIEDFLEMTQKQKNQLNQYREDIERLQAKANQDY